MPRRCRTLVAIVVLLLLAIPAEALAARRQPETRPTPAPPPAEAPAPDDRPLARNLGALQESLDRLARMDTAQWELLEALLTLDDEGWLMLKQLLSMPQEDLDRLVRSIEGNGGMAASIVDQSDPQSPDAPGPPGPADGEPPTPEAVLSLTYIYNQIVARVDSARGKIDGVRDRIDTLLPDQEDVRNLFESIPVSNVTKLIDTVKESFGNLIDTLDVLREGYDAFDDAAMRHDLMGFLDDLEELARIPQQLACFDDPDDPVRELKTDLLRKLIDKLPKVALVAMDKMLDAFAEDWRTSLQDVIDRVPMDLREGICNTSSEIQAEPWEGEIRDRRAAALAAPGDASSSACKALRKAEILGDLRIVRVTIRRFASSFEIISEFLDDKAELTFGVTAVGGATAGTAVKVPAKPTFKTLKIILDGLGWRIDNLLSRRDKCLAEDDRIERDLIACTPLAEYLIDLTDAKDVATRRVEELVDAGEASSSDQMDIEDADDFEELCETYRDILLD